MIFWFWILVAIVNFYLWDEYSTDSRLIANIIFTVFFTINQTLQVIWYVVQMSSFNNIFYTKQIIASKWKEPISSILNADNYNEYEDELEWYDRKLYDTFQKFSNWGLRTIGLLSVQQIILFILIFTSLI